ncbi:MAG: outer membrane protein [Syntrophobacteraceae bacterium]
MKLSRLVCLLSLACVLILSQTALAAESAPSFNWTGPYLGLHLGYGSGNDDDMNFTPLPVSLRASEPPLATLSPSPGGLVGGVQAGYNYQMGCFVYGIEADFSGSGMSGSQNVPQAPPFAPGVITAHENINWFGTLRPRLGYTVKPNVLIYATGGLAYGDVSYAGNNYFPIPGGAEYPASLSTTKLGWALGGGVEYALCKNWTVKAEYLYMDLGSESAISRLNGPFQVSYDWQTTANIFQVGVNYKF